jgi:hypothetical protein
MLAYTKDNFVYISIPKNGCTTFSNLCEKNGWDEINLLDAHLDLTDKVIWAHITDPEERYIKGIIQYLILNPSLSIDDPALGRLLVSGVFDVHTYSLNMLMGPKIVLPINWIPLDCPITDYRIVQHNKPIYNGDKLTNIFFEEYGIDLWVTEQDHLNVTASKPIEEVAIRIALKEKVIANRQMYRKNYNQVLANFLLPDILLYRKVCDQYKEKYGRK